MKILYAEDVADWRKIITAHLEEQGHKVKTVTNGQILLKHLRSHPTSYDVVLTDNQMPLLSGLEALRRIRADERFRELPVIILSGDHIFKIIVEELNATLVSKGENNLLRILDAALKNVVKVHARNRPA